MKSNRVCTVAVDEADGVQKLMCRAVGGAWACAATSTQPPRVRCKWGPVRRLPPFLHLSAASASCTSLQCCNARMYTCLPPSETV